MMEPLKNRAIRILVLIEDLDSLISIYPLATSKAQENEGTLIFLIYGNTGTLWKSRQEKFIKNAKAMTMSLIKSIRSTGCRGEVLIKQSFNRYLTLQSIIKEKDVTCLIVSKKAARFRGKKLVKMTSDLFCSLTIVNNRTSHFRYNLNADTFYI